MKTNPINNNNKGSLRVVRGGSWGNYAGNARSAGRYRRRPGYRNNSVGVRLVRTKKERKSNND